MKEGLSLHQIFIQVSSAEDKAFKFTKINLIYHVTTTTQLTTRANHTIPEFQSSSHTQLRNALLIRTRFLYLVSVEIAVCGEDEPVF
ncbi:hypothetical protein PPL_00236 [Heterostelium album PN500]|uniref:Uncharacterized protein n=1 Tax=Heterostelium pallidum (strain ATCC 26659 / Pp 5 / PN500) TaxID=670386 RepID=D3AVX1_HETP5|nr:hypothetical protein PPL_00236 [Heterostelium album PN500]EFA86444.1 hypothetical protein PPL_00236 [Heterostelium album PN500]|eukprot:XP_020438549.1 hypothetical protein PPL_00236 [Heterostelium album PN500]